MYIYIQSLIYTGIVTDTCTMFLQEVLRNWYARNPNIVETENALVILAQECAHGFIDGNILCSFICKTCLSISKRLSDNHAVSLVADL